MIIKESRLQVADNTGAKEAMCIGILGQNKKSAGIGDKIRVTIKSTIPSSPLKKGSVVTGVIVRTKKEKRRKDGSYIRFDDNAVIILNETGEMRGTRVFGPVARELRELKFMKIISLAPEVL